LQNNLEDTFVEKFKDFRNGWLPTEGIQAISTYSGKMIVLIYFDSCLIEIFIRSKFYEFLLVMNYLLQLLEK
jgi:hypothetical protein